MILIDRKVNYPEFERHKQASVVDRTSGLCLTVIMISSLQQFASCVPEFAESLPGSTTRSPYPTRRREFASSIGVAYFLQPKVLLSAFLFFILRLVVFILSILSLKNL
jgi:hypothetical protein